MSYIIEAEGLRKAFGKTQALDGVDLAAREGTVLGVLGPNGAGRPPRCGCWPPCCAPTPAPPGSTGTT